MAYFGRLRCHFCGTRSAHSKGITEFQCRACEAWNFFDKNGVVADTPSSRALDTNTKANKPRTFTSTSSLPSHQKTPVFCDTCVKNQQIYLESISNYFPDENDPRYADYEARFGDYKHSLEQRYPQVCAKCAPIAQTQIHHADLNSQRHTLAANMRKTRDRNQKGQAVRGMRDSTDKKAIRFLLRAVDCAVLASLAAQIAWHLYGAISAMPAFSRLAQLDDDLQDVEPIFPSPLTACSKQTMMLRFSQPCVQIFSEYVAYAVNMTALLLWYNPALRYYWHDTYSIGSTSGKLQYLKIQMIMLLIRKAALVCLSDTAVVDELTSGRRVAFHATLIVFLIFAEWLSRQNIGFQRKMVNTRIMPLPEEVDVLGAFAGPASVRGTSQASGVNPARLLQRNEAPFPIGNLAPRAFERHNKSTFGHPSPPESQSVSSEEDAMEIDWHQPVESRSTAGLPSHQRKQPPANRSIYNYENTQPLGWSAMRSETFRIQDDMQAQKERQQREIEQKQLTQLKYEPQVNRNPFRGSLPPAPMSMERRLRNPPARFEFRRADPTTQANFMGKMREGIEDAHTFRLEQQRKLNQKSGSQVDNQDRDLDGSQYDPHEYEIQASRSQLSREHEIRPGQWTWKGDLEGQSTGLEDLFGGHSFRIADEPAIPGAAHHHASSISKPRLPLGFIVTAFIVALVAMACLWFPVRRTAALWLFSKIEELGY